MLPTCLAKLGLTVAPSVHGVTVGVSSLKCFTSGGMPRLNTNKYSMDISNKHFDLARAVR